MLKALELKRLFDFLISGHRYVAKIEELVEMHNEQYISETMVRGKEHLDNVLKSVDPVVSLDEDQRMELIDMKKFYCSRL